MYTCTCRKLLVFSGNVDFLYHHLTNALLWRTKVKWYQDMIKRYIFIRDDTIVIHGQTHFSNTEHWKLKEEQHKP
jgi:hypothetical protein